MVKVAVCWFGASGKHVVFLDLLTSVVSPSSGDPDRHEEAKRQSHLNLNKQPTPGLLSRVDVIGHSPCGTISEHKLETDQYVSRRRKPPLL